jgi:hypothetical protein
MGRKILMLLLQEVEEGCGPKFGVLIFNLALEKWHTKLEAL